MADRPTPDPLDVVRGAFAIARLVPGVGLAERGARGLERFAVRQLARRLEDVDGRRPQVTTGEAGADERPPPQERLDRMLRRSMDQTQDQSHESLVDLVLESIVPDEARILSALADGSPYAVLHVNLAPRGRVGSRLLSNASSVGRAAGVALPDRVPTYLTHLEQLGLVEIGPEDPSLAEEEYDILATDATIRRAVKRAGSTRTRLERHAVTISEIGREFWRTCRPGP